MFCESSVEVLLQAENVRPNHSDMLTAVICCGLVDTSQMTLHIKTHGITTE